MDGHQNGMEQAMINKDFRFAVLYCLRQQSKSVSEYLPST